MCIRDRHYPEVEREVVWEQVQLRYAELLSKWRTDLGGKKNFHNGVGAVSYTHLETGRRDQGGSGVLTVCAEAQRT